MQWGETLPLYYAKLILGDIGQNTGIIAGYAIINKVYFKTQFDLLLDFLSALPEIVASLPVGVTKSKKIKIRKLLMSIQALMFRSSQIYVNYNENKERKSVNFSWV